MKDKTYLEALMHAPSRAEKDITFQDAGKRALPRSSAFIVFADSVPAGQDWGEISQECQWPKRLYKFGAGKYVSVRSPRKRRMKQVRLLEKKRKALS